MSVAELFRDWAVCCKLVELFIVDGAVVDAGFVVVVTVTEDVAGFFMYATRNPTSPTMPSTAMSSNTATTCEPCSFRFIMISYSPM
jgi:hypothetical protein